MTPQETLANLDAEDRAAIMTLRRELMQGHDHWSEVHGRHPSPNSETAWASERDASAASLMASSYAYTLAAVLGWTEQHFGTGYAAALAGVAKMILEDGDPDDLNADVAPPEVTA